MEELKALFGDGSLSYDEFETKLKEASDIKLVNLKSGLYVDKSKLDKFSSNYSELESRYNELLERTKNYEDDMKELEAFRTEKSVKEDIEKIMNAKVDSKFAKFVLSEVNSMVDENNKFDDVLAKYVKDNPQYLTIRQGVFKVGASTPNLEQGEPADIKSANQQMNDIIRNRGEN